MAYDQNLDIAAFHFHMAIDIPSRLKGYVVNTLTRTRASLGKGHDLFVSKRKAFSNDHDGWTDNWCVVSSSYCSSKPYSHYVSQPSFWFVGDPRKPRTSFPASIFNPNGSSPLEGDHSVEGIPNRVVRADKKSMALSFISSNRTPRSLPTVWFESYAHVREREIYPCAGGGRLECTAGPTRSLSRYCSIFPFTRLLRRIIIPETSHPRKRLR